MKRTLQYFPMFITLICLVLSITSCQGTERKSKNISLSGYTVIYSHNASDDVINAATELKNAIGSVEISDDLTLTDTNDRKEILIGATNRTETFAYSETIKLLDYVIEHNDGRIIICGGSPESTVNAVSYFIANCLNEDKTEANAKKYTYSHTYEVETVQVDATDFACFNVITNVTDDTYNETIDRFKKRFTEKTGHSSTSHGHALNIMLKNDSDIATDSFKIKVSESDISLIGANVYGINAAIDYFFDSLIKDGNLILNNGDEFEGKVSRTDSIYGKYINERTPLYNTYKRLSEDRELNIVYFGGSVTSGYGADIPEEDSWRTRVGDWFETTFTNAVINNYDASISTSGSMMGAFRCEHDVTSLSPDLVFIDFAVSDAYCQTEDEDIITYYEYIIRTIKQNNPNCDIVALYITDQSNARNNSNGLLPEAAAQDSVASHYNISSISMGQALCSTFDYNDDSLWQKYFIDIVHPTSLGYSVYFDVIREYLEANLIYGDAKADTVPEYTLNERLSEAEFEPRFILPSEMDIISSTNWEYSEDSYWDTANPYEGYLYPTDDNNELVISFEGKHAALMAQYSIDNRLVYSFDDNHERIQNQKGNHPLLLEASMDDSADEHTLKLSVQIKDQSTPYIISALLVW